MTIPQSVTVTDLRRKSASILRSLDKEKLLLLLQNSKPKGVLVEIEYIKMLQEAYEDYMDILAFDQTLGEPALAWSDYKKKSKKVK